MCGPVVHRLWVVVGRSAKGGWKVVCCIITDGKRLSFVTSGCEGVDFRLYFFVAVSLVKMPGEEALKNTPVFSKRGAKVTQETASAKVAQQTI